MVPAAAVSRASSCRPAPRRRRAPVAPNSQVDRFETSKKVRTVKGEKVEWFIMTGEAETSRGTVREDFEYDLQEVGHKLGISFEFDFEALEK